MEFYKRIPFSFTTKTISSLLSLVACLFFFVFGLTFGIGVCFFYKSFSINLQITNGQFSIVTSQTLQNRQLNLSSTSVQENITTASNTSRETWSEFSKPNITAASNTSRETWSELSKPNITTSNTSRETWQEFLIPPLSLMHNMSDEELIRRALMVSKMNEIPFKHVAKVAFMFLTKGPVILAPLWEKFFKGHQGLYSIYVHSNPSYNGTDDKGSVFYGRGVPSKEVQWGKPNMIEAERRLLANALLDFSNQHFVLLSESCIPLFNFSTIYSYLMNSTENFVESYDLPGPVGRGRYNRKMKPVIRINQWRKGSQWFSIDKDLAIKVISDTKYFPVFQNYCSGSCYADEHYLPTFVGIKTGIKNSNRTLTWVDWSGGGAHPSRFIRPHVTPDFLEKLRSGSSCKYNGQKTNVCFLFARKFTLHALDRLLRFAPKAMHFNK